MVPPYHLAMKRSRLGASAGDRLCSVEQQCESAWERWLKGFGFGEISSVSWTEWISALFGAN